MVTWISSGNKVYEIYYSSKQEEFFYYLGTVQEMINSFQLITSSEPISSEPLQISDAKEDRLLF
jgi:hypothetical protein